MVKTLCPIEFDPLESSTRLQSSLTRKLTNQQLDPISHLIFKSQEDQLVYHILCEWGQSGC